MECNGQLVVNLVMVVNDHVVEHVKMRTVNADRRLHAKVLENKSKLVILKNAVSEPNEGEEEMKMIEFPLQQIKILVHMD